MIYCALRNIPVLERLFKGENMENCILLSKEDLLFNAKNIIDAVNSPVIAVVKCNGYGIGIDKAVQIWYEAGIRYFAVSEPKEAFSIRAMGYEDCNILLLAPVWDKQTIQRLCDCNVILTVTSKECAENYASVAAARVHVKVNVGMGRFGIKHTKTDLIKEIYTVEGLSFEGIFAHFPMAFGDDETITFRQLNDFTGIVQELRSSGINTGIAHIANSSAALKYPATHLDAVRIGSALTGRLLVNPGFELKRIGIFRATVADVNELEKNDTSGYSCIYKAKKDVKTAVITAGYTDGIGMERVIPIRNFRDRLSRILKLLRGGKSAGTVKYENKKLPILGRIGTQYTVIGRGKTDIKPGDTVEIDVNMMLINSNVPRVYKENI